MEIRTYSENKLNFIEVSNKDLKVTLCDLGASLYAIDFLDKPMLMTLCDSNKFWASGIYHGKTVGRSGNRIRGNKITIDNKEFFIEDNESGNTLHGGINGLSTKVFTSKIEKNNDSLKVIYEYVSLDGESGFPGDLKIRISYCFYENFPRIRIDFDAKTNKPTLCDLTNHAFYILGEENLNSLSLQINSSTYLKTEVDTLLPLSMEKVNKELDFRNSKPIMESINSPEIKKGKANGYDHYFLFDNNNKEPQIFLQSKNLTLEIKSDFEGVQIYTDNYEDDNKWFLVKGKKNRSIAIEPMDNYLNRKVLYPNEEYSRYIELNFKKN